MKPRAEHRRFGTARWPIFYKVFIFMVLIILGGIGGGSYVLARSAYDRLQEEAYAALRLTAHRQAERVTDLLLDQIAFVRYVALDGPLVVEAADRSRTYDQVTAAALAAAWPTAADDSALVRQVIDVEVNPLAAVLQTYVQDYPTPVSLLLVDRQGVALAATYRPEAYQQRDAIWWTAAYAGGAGQLAIAQPTLDSRTGATVLRIAAPLYAPDNTLIGFVVASFDMTPLRDIIGKLAISENRWCILFDASYTPVAETSRSVTGGVTMAWLASVSRGGGVLPLSLANGESALGAATWLNTAAIPDADAGAAIESLHWSLMAFQTTRVIHDKMRQVARLGVILPAILISSALLLGWLTARNIKVPVQQLKQVLEKEAAGDQNVLAWVYAPDELGTVAENINRLFDEKRSLTATVARRADERAREQARRQRDLEAAAAVGQVASTTLDIAGLAQQVTNLIRERFGLYFVGLFLLNESRTRAVLQAGTGESGAALLARGYGVAPGEGGIGVCIADGAPHWTELPGDAAPVALELPYARAEIALPLRSRGEALGAFWILSYHADTFDDEMRIVLQTIADQVAVAIDSIRLFTERQEAAVRLQRAYGEATQAAWEELMRTRNFTGAGYEARLAGVTKLAPAEPETWHLAAQEAWTEGTLVLAGGDSSDDLREHSLAIPISSRGEIIGVIDVAKPATFGDWTLEEKELLQALTSQLGVAMENARLYEEAQERAIRQRLLSDISGRIRASLNVDTVLQTAVQEMRALLGLSAAEVRMGLGFEASPLSEPPNLPAEEPSAE